MPYASCSREKNQTTKPVEASSLARSSAPTLFAQKLQKHEGLSKTEVKEGGVTFSLEPTPRVARDDGDPAAGSVEEIPQRCHFSWLTSLPSPAPAPAAAVVGSDSSSASCLFPGRRSAWTAAGTARTEAGDGVDRLYSRGWWPGMERLLGVDRRPNLPGRLHRGRSGGMMRTAQTAGGDADRRLGWHGRWPGETGSWARMAPRTERWPG